MLRLWRDVLRVVVAPERLVLVRTSRWRKHVMEQRVIDIPVDSPLDWKGALHALREASHDVAWQHTAVRVVLSNRLARFMMTPALDAGSAQWDPALIANHYFKEAYGEVAANWTCHLDEAGGRIAMAIDTALLDALKQCFGRPGYRMTTVQPALAVAFNRWRTTFGAQPQWFTMTEAGHAWVCLFVRGEWREVRSVEAVDDLPAEVMRTMARAQILADLEHTPDTQAVLALDDQRVVLPTLAGCMQRRLEWPAARGRPQPTAGVALALAV